MGQSCFHSSGTCDRKGLLILGQTGNDLKGSFIPVFINTMTQVYYLFALRNKNPQTYQSKLTNIVNITFAGV